jgi:hypothetical protein|nr:MAG TPA: hypothetical protein [Caudoviricetes sp.]DAW18810.1 MAG TPA: hypothetical protein [Bacteriophage sp.]
MIEMDKVRKWPREHLEKRFHELDAHIDELESKVNDLEDMKSYLEAERDGCSQDCKRTYKLLTKERNINAELTSTVLVLSKLLAEARRIYDMA